MKFTVLIYKTLWLWFVSNACRGEWCLCCQDIWNYFTVIPFKVQVDLNWSQFLLEWYDGYSGQSWLALQHASKWHRESFSTNFSGASQRIHSTPTTLFSEFSIGTLIVFDASIPRLADNACSDRAQAKTETTSRRNIFILNWSLQLSSNPKLPYILTATPVIM